MLWIVEACRERLRSNRFEAVKPFVIIILILACAPMWADSVQILPAPPSAPGAGAFQIMIVVSGQNSTVALQWILTVPENIKIAPEALTPGEAAQHAKKSLSCALSREKLSGRTAYRCVLAGGAQPLASGAIVVAHFTAAAGITSAKVRLDGILGVGQNLTPIPIAPVEATIRVAAAP